MTETNSILHEPAYYSVGRTDVGKPARHRFPPDLFVASTSKKKGAVETT